MILKNQKSQFQMHQDILIGAMAEFELEADIKPWDGQNGVAIRFVPFESDGAFLDDEDDSDPSNWI